MPRPDPLGFRRELTPTWLHATTLLGGHRPPDLSRPFRAAYLGCGTGVTPAVVAAVHPDSEIWAWDFRPGPVERTRRLRDAAGLGNLAVHERPGLPHEFAAGPCDVVVVAGVLDAIGDDACADVVAAIGASLRPGGVLCVTYRTTVGWIELAPVQRLMRYLAHRDAGAPAAVTNRVLDFIAQLQREGAAYLARPSVSAWLESLRAADPERVFAEHLAEDMHPLSHPTVADALTPAGCAYLGSARLSDDLGVDLPDALQDLIVAAPTPAVREMYHDLAVRRATRADVFRHGSAPIPADEYSSTLGKFPIANLTDADVAVSGDDPDEVGFALRMLFDGGEAHPLAANPVTPEARARSDALNDVLHDRSQDTECLMAIPAIGSAISASPPPSSSVLTRLGAS